MPVECGSESHFSDFRIACTGLRAPDPTRATPHPGSRAPSDPTNADAPPPPPRPCSLCVMATFYDPTVAVAADFTVHPVANCVPQARGGRVRVQVEPTEETTGVVAVFNRRLLSCNILPPSCDNAGVASTSLETYAAERLVGCLLVKVDKDVCLPPGLVHHILPGVGRTSKHDTESIKAAGYTKRNGHKCHVLVKLAEDGPAAHVLYAVDVVAYEPRDGVPMRPSGTTLYQVVFTAVNWEATDLSGVDASLARLRAGAAGWAASLVSQCLRIRATALAPLRFGGVWQPAIDDGWSPWLRAATLLDSRALPAARFPECTNFGAIRTRDLYWSKTLGHARVFPAAWSASSGRYRLLFQRQVQPDRGQVLAAQLLLVGDVFGMRADATRGVAPEVRAYAHVNMSVTLHRATDTAVAAVVRFTDVRATAAARQHTAWMLCAHDTRPFVWDTALELLAKPTAEQNADLAKHLPRLYAEVVPLVVAALEGQARRNVSLTALLMTRALDRALRGGYAAGAPDPVRRARLEALEIVVERGWFGREYHAAAGGLQEWSTLPVADWSGEVDAAAIPAEGEEEEEEEEVEDDM